MPEGVPSVDDMGHEELRAEWQDVVEQLRGPIVDEEEDEQLWNRRRELWSEMQSRVDSEPPECPECGEASWSQTMGGPKHCDGCDLHLGEQHTDLIQAVDGYWDTVLSGGKDAE